MASIVEIVVSATDKTKGAVDSAGEGFEGLGKTATAGMAVAAAAVAGVGLAVAKFAEALTDAMDIEAANDKLAAQLGLTAQQSEAFGRAAGNLYANAYGESLDEVNEALRYVQQNLGDLVGESEGALEAATATVLDFSAAFGEDLGPTTKAVGQMIKTGLAVDAQQALDILTVGMQQGVNSSEDLLDTFEEYSTMFREIGISGEMALGLMSQALKAGARDSDTAADALKEFAIRSKDASTSSMEGFKLLGLNGEKMTKVFAKGGPEAAQGLDTVLDRLRAMKNPVDQNAAAVALFGTKAEDLGRALFSMDPTTAVASLGEVSGAAQRMGETLADNAATKLEAFKRGLQQNVSNFMTETVLPAVVTFAENLSNDLSPALEDVKKKGEEAFEWAKDKPEVLGAVAGVISVALVAAFVALGSAAWGAAAGVIAATWPILAIAAVIGGLVAALVYAYNNWDTFRNAVDTAVSWIRDNAAPIFEQLKSTIISFYETAIVPLINYIKENGEAFSNIGKILVIIAAIIVGLLVAALLAGAGAFMIAVGVIAVVVTAIVALVAVLYNLVQVAWDVFNNVRDFLGGVIEKIEEVIQFFWDLVQNVASAIATAAVWVWNLFTAVAGMVGAVIGKIIEVADWFRGLPGRILEALGDLGSTLWNSGVALVQGLWDGISSRVQWLKDKVSGALSTIRGLFPSSPAKEGPFSGQGYTDVSGRHLAEDFAKGILHGSDAIRVAAASAMQGARSEFSVADAASEALAHLRGGGMLEEDFSFAGMSSAFAGGKFWHRLADGFYAQNPGVDYGSPAGRAAFERYLTDAAGGGPTVTFAGDTDSVFATAFMKLQRTGQIQITAGV